MAGLTAALAVTGYLCAPSESALTPPMWQRRVGRLPALPRGLARENAAFEKRPTSAVPWNVSSLVAHGMQAVWEQESIAQTSARREVAVSKSLRLDGLGLCGCELAPLHVRLQFVDAVADRALAILQARGRDAPLVLTDLGSGSLLQLRLQLEMLVRLHDHLAINIVELRLPTPTCGQYRIGRDGTLRSNVELPRGCRDASRGPQSRAGNEMLLFIAQAQQIAARANARIDVEVFQSSRAYVAQVNAEGPGGTLPADIATLVDPQGGATTSRDTGNVMAAVDEIGPFAVWLADDDRAKPDLHRLPGAQRSALPRVENLLQAGDTRTVRRRLIGQFPAGRWFEELRSRLLEIRRSSPDCWIGSLAGGHVYGDMSAETLASRKMRRSIAGTLQ